MKRVAVVTLLLAFVALVAIANINKTTENKTEKKFEKKAEKKKECRRTCLFS